MARGLPWEPGRSRSTIHDPGATPTGERGAAPMKTREKKPPLLLALAAVITLAIGCGKLEPRSLMTANQPPVITLGRPTLESGTDESRLVVRWTARDPDGRVDHYLYAVDPATVDRVDSKWMQIRETQAVARFARHTATGRLSTDKRDETHVFAVRAVDDRGAISAPVSVAVVGDNIAPSVVITDPQPSPVFAPITGTSVQIRWSGQDPDGQLVKYKFRLFPEHNPDF